MNTRPMKIITIALGIGAALFSGANTAWASTFGSEGDQKTYRFAAKQDTPKIYQYVNLQSGEVVKASMMWRCENTNGVGIKKYVELPTGTILHLNCGK